MTLIFFHDVTGHGTGVTLPRSMLVDLFFFIVLFCFDFSTELFFFSLFLFAFFLNIAHLSQSFVLDLHVW